MASERGRTADGGLASLRGERPRTDPASILKPTPAPSRSVPLWATAGIALTLALLLSTCHTGAGRGPVADAMVVPGVRVGAVDSTTSERALLERLGARRVVRRDIFIGEGFCAPGSVIDPGTRDSVIVLWADTTFTRPAAVTVSGRGSRWRTPSGVRVGMPLDELEALNSGQPIQFMGFGWDYGGTGSWTEGGRALAIVLRPDSASYAAVMSDPRAQEILGDHEVSSAHALVRGMRIHVERMSIRWVQPAVQYPCTGL